MLNSWSLCFTMLTSLSRPICAHLCTNLLLFLLLPQKSTPNPTHLPDPCPLPPQTRSDEIERLKGMVETKEEKWLELSERL
jgi:hypothetical protein